MRAWGKKCRRTQGAVDAGQIHTHHPDVGLAFQPRQVGLQSGFRTSQHDIIDLAMAQIAEGGGVALAPGEKVFVEAQHGRAARRMALPELAVDPAPEIALHRSGANAFPPPQAAAVDAVQVLLIRWPSGRPRWRAGSAGCRAEAGGSGVRSSGIGTSEPGPRARNGGVPSPRGALSGEPTPCCAARSRGNGRRISARYTGPRFSGFPLSSECR